MKTFYNGTDQHRQWKRQATRQNNVIRKQVIFYMLFAIGLVCFYPHLIISSTIYIVALACCWKVSKP